MDAELQEDDGRIFQELEELVALEVRDILATARSEGFEERDVVHALERALAAEIRALTVGSPTVDVAAKKDIEE